MTQVEVAKLTFPEIDRIRPLLQASQAKPLRYLMNDLRKELDSFWFDSIAELQREKDAQVFAAFGDNGVEGVAVYTNNPWESKILGKGAGVINYLLVDPCASQKGEILKCLLDAVIGWVASRQIQLLLCKPYADDMPVIHALEQQGFSLMDTIMDCHYDFRRFPRQVLLSQRLSSDVTLRLANKNDVEELISVARAAFQEHFGRYHVDERIGREAATRFYVEWIKSSVDGYADWICVAEVGNRIVGYSIWKKPSALEQKLGVRVSHYSIAGIHPDFFGRGLFTALTLEGMKLLDGVADVVEGPTHVNNYGVQLGYAKLGWRVCSDARHSFHKWLNTAG